ncbi:TPA: LuxR C-terminal-related transcriptional regulator [Yersinia enterocolitica]
MIYLFSSCEYFSYGFKSICRAKFLKIDFEVDIITISDLDKLKNEIYNDGDIVFINYYNHNEKLLLILMDIKLRVEKVNIVVLYHFNKGYKFIDEMVFFNITKLIISRVNCICNIHTIMNNYHNSNEFGVFIFNKNNIDVFLNKNEKVIVTYILLGLNNKKISKKMNLSYKTISYYRGLIYKKLNINSLPCLFIRLNKRSELLVD